MLGLENVPQANTRVSSAVEFRLPAGLEVCHNGSGNGVCLPEWENRLIGFSADDSYQRHVSWRGWELWGTHWGYLWAGVWAGGPDGELPALSPIGLVKPFPGEHWSSTLPAHLLSGCLRRRLGLRGGGWHRPLSASSSCLGSAGATPRSPLSACKR